MRQPIPTVRAFEHGAELLSALGLARSELPILEYDNGMQHVYVVVDSDDVVRGLRPDLGRLAALADAGVNVLAISGNQVKTRMFAPSHGVSEDAATGSAAGPLAVHLARHGRAQFGETLEIHQGAEIARPSLLYAIAHGTSEQVDRVDVGGAAVIVGRGELRVA
jgi:trans-2,3-dihydro-3-hydroxyanthranilate isomerase